MMIKKHVCALVDSYQCVTGPGVGAFITETTSARYNTTTNTFVPAMKHMLFTSLLQQNDGLLANHISLQENIGFNEAVTLIKNQVTAWNVSLKENQSVYLKNIGELSLNTENNIQFEPVGSTNYLTSSFGLTAVVV